MTQEMERRWDDAVEQAWVEFRQRVADRLAEMSSGETLLVELPQDDEMDGAAPYCQVMADDSWLRVEAVSNAFLAPEFAHDQTQEAALCELGFASPEGESSPNFAADLEQREADRAAVMMVRALREVYGVLHPVYLDASGLQPQPAPTEEAPTSGEEERVVFPEDVDELRAAVHRVATSMLGREPEWDDDGDLPLFTDKTVVYVTLSRTAPRVLMFANLVDEVVDLDRALVEVNLLNKHEFGLTFVLNERRIHVRRELPVSAFVPEEFKAELQRLADHVDEWVSELLLRVGGRGWLDDGAAQRPQGQVAQSEPEPEDQRFRQALRVLRELEGEERGSVDPAMMLRIFHSDRDLLLAAIRYSAGRASTWGSRLRKAEEEGKAGYARMCRSRQRYYHELRGRQRRALRLAVQASAKRERQAQLPLFSEDEAASS